MKSKRTIRTLLRAGIDPQRIGFAGFLPTGKHVRRMARTMRAERRLINELYTREGGANLVWLAFPRGVRSIVAIKTATKLLRAAQK